MKHDKAAFYLKCREYAQNRVLREIGIEVEMARIGIVRDAGRRERLTVDGVFLRDWVEARIGKMAEQLSDEIEAFLSSEN